MMPESGYIGRFAPSPSGPLHFGSIIAALGSFLQARQHNGKWLVRIEDVDLPRTVSGADKIILNQLERLGLFWDEDVIYQSHRTQQYESAFEHLNKQNLLFPCICSRKETANKPYQGTCRNGIDEEKRHFSTRIKTEDRIISINDLLQGNFSQSIGQDVGDFVIKRSDGLFAYHLAVVVDDAEQKVSEVVRGFDLLDSTPRQIYLQKALGFLTPEYLHLPIAIDSDGNKISKQDHAPAIKHDDSLKTIFNALEFLGQKPPAEALETNTESLLQWAVKHWRISLVPKETKIAI